MGVGIDRRSEQRDNAEQDIAECQQDSMCIGTRYRATPPSSGNGDTTAESPLFVTASEAIAPWAVDKDAFTADRNRASSPCRKSPVRQASTVLRTASDSSQIFSSLQWWDNRLHSVTEASESPAAVSPGPYTSAVAAHFASRRNHESQMEVDDALEEMIDTNVKSTSRSPSQISQRSDHSILMSPRGSRSFLGHADDEPDGSVSLLYREIVTEAPVRKNSGSGEMEQFVTCVDYEEPPKQEPVHDATTEAPESPWRPTNSRKGHSMPEVILQPHDRGDRSPVSSAAPPIAVPLLLTDDPALAGPVHPGDPDPVLSGFCGPPSFWCASPAAPAAAQMSSVSSTFVLSSNVLSSNLQSSVEGHQGSMRGSSAEMVAVRPIGGFEEHPKSRTRIGPALLKLLCALEGGRYSETPVLPVHRFLPEIKVKCEQCMETYSSSHSMHGVAAPTHAANGPTSNVTNGPTSNVSNGPVSNVPSAAQTADILSTASNAPHSNTGALKAQPDASPRAYVPPASPYLSRAGSQGYPSSQTTGMLHSAQSCASGPYSHGRPRSIGPLSNGPNSRGNPYSIVGPISGGDMSTRDMCAHGDMSTVGTYPQGNETPRTPTHEIGRTLPGSECSCAFDYHLEREAASERDATDTSEQHYGRGLTSRSLLDNSETQSTGHWVGDRAELRNRRRADRKNALSRDSPFFNPDSLAAPLEGVPRLRLHEARVIPPSVCIQEQGPVVPVCVRGVPQRVDIPVARVAPVPVDSKTAQNSCMPSLWRRSQLPKASRDAPVSLTGSESRSLPRSLPRSQPQSYPRPDSQLFSSRGARAARVYAAQNPAPALHPPKAPGGFAKMMGCLRSSPMHDQDASTNPSLPKSTNSVSVQRGYMYEAPKGVSHHNTKLPTPRRLKLLLMPQARNQSDESINTDMRPPRPSSMPLFCCTVAPPSPKVYEQGPARGVAEGPSSTNEMHRRYRQRSYGLHPPLESPPSQSHYITTERTSSHELLHAVSNALSCKHARDASSLSLSQSMHYDPNSISTAPAAILRGAKHSSRNSVPSTDESRSRGVRLYPQPAKLLGSGSSLRAPPATLLL